MDSVQLLRAEVARLSRQSASDFEFTALALKDMGLRINAFGREMQVGFDQLAGRMKLQEQRFGDVLQAVDNALELYEPTWDRLSDLDRRVQALEKKQEPAA